MYRRRISVSIVVLCLGFGVLLAGAPDTARAQAGFLDNELLLRETMDRLGLAQAELLELDPLDAAFDEAPGEIAVPLRLEAGVVTLHLERHSVRALDFRLLVQGEDGEIVETPAIGPRTYRGWVEGRPQWRAAASLTPEGGLRALVDAGEDGLLAVQPVLDAVPGARPTVHVAYRSADIFPLENFRCGIPDVPPEDDLGHHGSNGMAPATVGNVKLCEIAFDADREFYVLNGSDVNATVLDIEGVVNAVAFIYQRDAEITYAITSVLVRTSEPDPYGTTDPATLLYDFRDEWNAHQGGVQRDVAHLMTGKDLDDSVIGIAFIGVICSSTSGYGLSQSRFTTNIVYRTALTAHETGHNWSATHCSGGDCRIMCPGLGGCSGDVTAFGGLAKLEITTHRNSRTCLSEIEAPLAAPFVDTFPSSDIDEGKWADIVRAAVADIGQNEPTQPWALNLDALGNGANDDDSLRTKPLLLAGTVPVTVSYCTEARGVDNGEKLFFEYWGTDAAWHPLETVVSDGTTEDFFTFRHHRLTGSTLHDDFRLRIRCDVNNALDEWFVDDVCIAKAPVLVTLTPHATQVGRGAYLYFDAGVTNTTTQPQSGEAWIDLVAPDGSPLFAGGNPKIGPKPFSLNGSQSRTKSNLKIVIPAGATPGPGYKMIAILGDSATNLVSCVHEFSFEVTP